MRRFLRPAALAVLAAVWLAAPAGADCLTDHGTWIDVRTPEEYAAGHLEGSVNIPHEEIADRIGEVADDTETEIHVYCGSGRRAGMAKATLEDLGFADVTNEGGYDDLKKKDAERKAKSEAEGHEGHAH